MEHIPFRLRQQMAAGVVERHVDLALDDSIEEPVVIEVVELVPCLALDVPRPIHNAPDDAADDAARHGARDGARYRTGNQAGQGAEQQAEGTKERSDTRADSRTPD